MGEREKAICFDKLREIFLMNEALWEVAGEGSAQLRTGDAVFLPIDEVQDRCFV